MKVGPSESPWGAPTHVQPQRWLYMMASGKAARKAATGTRDNGPLSRLRFPRGCVAFTVLEPVSKSQRLFRLAVVGIGPPGGRSPVDLGGLLDGGQRVLPPAQVGQAGRQVIQRAGQVRPDRVRAGFDGRTPRSLVFVPRPDPGVGGEEEHVIFAVAAEFHRVTARRDNGTLIGGSGLGVGHPPYWQSEPAPIRTASGMEG